MHRTVLASLCVVGLTALAVAAPKTEKEALQELNEFIGKWDGNGGPSIGRGTPADIWKESMNWGWKFGKDDAAWLIVDVADGKHFTDGELRYLSGEEVYALTLTGTDGKERTFKGELTRGTLTLIHEDPATKDRARIQMNTNNEGARFVYEYAEQKGGRGIYRRLFTVQHTKEGQTLAAGNKDKECVVTGGLGTSQVSFNGKTYYVCCSGCAEAFRENPAKIVAEYEARKKK